MKYIKKLLPWKRSRTTKKILGFLAIFALSGAFFQGNVGVSEVHAQTLQDTNPINPTTIDKIGLVELLDLVLKVIYILLWPLLVVAGRAMDNTLVYGAIFHLDVPLWKFWNILKNFANFTLGFLVLFAILKSIFTNSGAGSLKDGKTPLGIIKKTLIAGILIQASRFLLAATIDLSTVATYAVGGLPLSVLKTTDLGQKKILAVDANIDLNKIANLNDNGDIISLTYSAGPHKLSACKLSNDTCSASGDYRYIIGRKQMSGTEMGKCVFGGNMVMIYDETGLQNDTVRADLSSTYESFVQGSVQSCISPTKWEERIGAGMIIDIYSGASFSSGKNAGQERFANTPAMMLADLVTRSKGFVGPMVTIYSSLLNFAEISDTGVDSFGKVSGEMIIRTGFAIMLFFPLLALAVVLIIRVGFLWLIIAASPFIILVEVFKDAIPAMPEAIKKHFDIKNIFSVIFAPVVSVFAMSLAVIFITTLISTFTPKTGTNVQDTSISTALEPTIQKLPSDGGSQKYLVGGSQMTLTNFNRGGSLDRFSWIIVNLISVGLMRALVFAAIKANSLGKTFAAPIEKFGGNFMSTLPIISVPGSGEKVGFGTLGRVAKETPERYTSFTTNKQEEVGRKFAEEKFGMNNEVETNMTITSQQHTDIAGGLRSTANIETQIANINATRKEEEKISTVQYISDINNLNALNDVIKTMSDQNAVRDNAATLRGTQVFQKNVNEGATADSLTTLLNTKNEIIQNYATGQIGKIVTGTGKDGKKYKITKEGDVFKVIEEKAPVKPNP